MPYYRVYYIRCNVTDKIFVGMRTSQCEEESTSLTIYSAIRYILLKNKNNNMYNKFAQHFNDPQLGDTSAKKISKFSILFDKELFEDKDLAYEHMASKQVKLAEMETLLNDFIMDNEKILCSCGNNVRKIFFEQHKQKYCTKKKQPLYLDL